MALKAHAKTGDDLDHLEAIDPRNAQKSCERGKRHGACCGDGAARASRLLNRRASIAHITLLSFYVSLLGGAFHMSAPRVAEARIDPLRAIERQIRKGNMLVVLDTSGSMTGSPGESFAADAQAETWELGVDCDQGVDCRAVNTIGTCQSSGRICTNDAQCQLGYCQFGQDPCLDSSDCPLTGGLCSQSGEACLYNSDCPLLSGTCSVWGSCSSSTSCPSVGLCSDDGTTVCSDPGSACAVRHCSNDLTKSCTQDVDCNPSNSDGSDTTAGLLGHWMFDETDEANDADESTVAFDSSGDAGDAYAVDSNATTGYVSGYINNAMSLVELPSPPTYYRVPASPALKGLSAGMSVAAWIQRTDAAGGEGALMSWPKDDVGDQFFWFGTQDGKVKFTNRGLTDIQAPGAIALNTWAHVAATWDLATDMIRLYVDGTEVASGSAQHDLDPNNTTNDVLIGAESLGTSILNTWEGLIDDLRFYGRALSAIEVAELSGTPPTIPTYAEPGLLARLEFESNLNDSSGSGNHATKYDSGSPVYVPGKNGLGLYYNGVDDCIQLPNTSDFYLLSGYTIAAWAKYSDIEKDHMDIVGKSHDSGWNSSYRLLFEGDSNPSSRRFRVYQPGNNRADTQAVQQDEWVHHALTWTGSYWQHYHNGVPTSGGSSGGANTVVGVQDPPSVGCYQAAVGIIHHHMAGVLDDVRVYNRALSASEIAEVYASGAGVSASDLLVYLPFDEAPDPGISDDGTQRATPTPDNSGNGNVGFMRCEGYFNGETAPTNCALGPANTAASSGQVGNGFSAGAEQYAEIIPNTAMDGKLDEGWTASMWVRPKTLGSAKTLLFREGFVDISIDASNQLLASSNSTSIGSGGADFTNTSTWRHVLLRRENSPSGLTLFIDGAQVATLSSPPAVSLNLAESFFLGAEKSGGALINWGDADIDEFRLYAVELEADQIADLHSGTAPPTSAGCLQPQCLAQTNSCSVSSNVCEAGSSVHKCLEVNSTDRCIEQTSEIGIARICRFAQTACTTDAHCQEPYKLASQVFEDDACVPASSRAIVAKRVLRSILVENTDIMNFGLMTFSQGYRDDEDLDGIRDRYYYPYYPATSSTTATETRYFPRYELEAYGCFDSGASGGDPGPPTATCTVGSVTYNLDASMNSRYEAYRGDGNAAPIDMNWCGSIRCQLASTSGQNLYRQWTKGSDDDASGTVYYAGSYYSASILVGADVDTDSPKFYSEYKGRSMLDGGIRYNYYHPRTDYYSNPQEGQNRPPISEPTCVDPDATLSSPGDADSAQCSMTCGAWWDPVRKPEGGQAVAELPVDDSDPTLNEQNVQAMLPLLEKAKDGGFMFFGQTPTGCALFNNFGVESSNPSLTVPTGSSTRQYSAYHYMDDVKTRDTANDAARASCRDNFVLLLTDGAATGPGDGEAVEGDKTALLTACASSACEAADPRAAGCACKAVLNAQKLREELGVLVYVVAFSPDATRGVPGQINDNIARAGGTCREGVWDDPAEAGYIAPRTGDASHPFEAPAKCAYRADNEAELRREIQQVVYAATAGSYSTTPASSVGSIQLADSIDPARVAIDARVDFPDWRGHLVAYDTASDPPALLWDAGSPAFFPEPDTTAYESWAGWKDRVVYTSNGTTMIKIEVGNDDRISNRATLATVNVFGAPVFANEDEADRVLRWMLGDPAQGNRSVLGAFINSTPIAVGQPGASPLPGGQDFFDTHENRPQLIYVGSSDGMLHAFAANDINLTGGGSYSAGEEVFAYIPPDMLKRVVDIYSQGGQLIPPEEHLFGLAASPKVKSLCYTACTDDSLAKWKTVLAMGAGWGGNDAFVLDVTSPFTYAGGFADQLATPPVSIDWHSEDTVGSTTKADYDDMMGLATSTPAFYFGKGADMKDQRVIMASGYATGDSPPAQMGTTLVNADLFTGNILDSDTLASGLDPEGVETVCANTAVYGERTAYTDVAVARDHDSVFQSSPTSSSTPAQQIAAAYFGDTWGNLWRYVPSRDGDDNTSNSGTLSAVAGFGCEHPLHFSPTVVQLDRDDPVNHAGEVYLIQVTNGSNDPATEGFQQSKVILRKEIVNKTSGTFGGVESSSFASLDDELVMQVGTDDLCYRMDPSDPTQCDAGGQIPLDSRPTSTPLAILKSDGTGFQFITLWYQPPQTGCDLGNTYLTVHEVDVGNANTNSIITQKTGLELAQEPVTSAIIAGEKIVFIDSDGVHDITQSLGMSFVVGSALNTAASNGGLRYQTTGWREMP